MRKKRLSTEVRQAQIIKAAWVLIPRIGSENVTVRKLANSIGVTEPAVYRHFKNKKELVDFCKNKNAKLIVVDVDKNVENVYTYNEGYIGDQLLFTQI